MQSLWSGLGEDVILNPRRTIPIDSPGTLQCIPNVLHIEHKALEQKKSKAWILTRSPSTSYICSLTHSNKYTITTIQYIPTIFHINSQITNFKHPKLH